MAKPKSTKPMSAKPKSVKKDTDSQVNDRPKVKNVKSANIRTKTQVLASKENVQMKKSEEYKPPELITTRVVELAATIDQQDRSNHDSDMDDDEVPIDYKFGDY